MLPSHVLRTDGGGTLGFGHINRCLVLADAIRERGGVPEIVLGTASPDTHVHIAGAGHVCRQLDPAKIFDPEQTLHSAAFAIFDFSHRKTRSHIEEAHQLLEASQKNDTRTLLIDAKDEECLSALTTMVADILVIPYAGADAEQVMPGAKTDVRGLEYFVLDRAYLDKAFTDRPIPETVRNVLVTAGGSDPVGLTLFFLDVLEKIAAPLNINVVIGPGFAPDLTTAIALRAERMHHNTCLIHTPDNLADEVFRADLALSASGLTKYELAYSGTPSLLVSIDRNHDISNQPFAALGTGLYAGKYGVVTIDELVASVKSLLGDAERRRALAKAGPAAIDGKGTQRLLDLLDG